MNYLIWRAGTTTAPTTSSNGAASKDLSQRILDTNPVLEALGNAKSIRNNNSSRFGKYVNLKFSTSWKVMGAEVRTFLLEKSRVTNATLAKERSYHIFYQLLAGAQLEAFGAALPLLRGKAPADFLYTSQSGTGYVDVIDDAADFAEVDAALTSCGFTSNAKQTLYGIFISLLFLGNIAFDGAEDAGDLAVAAESHAQLQQAVELLGISDISRLLVEKVVHSPRSSNVYHIPLGREPAIKQRDALVRQIYHMLFEHIVARLNQTINTEKDSYRFIGALECVQDHRSSLCMHLSLSLRRRSRHQAPWAICSPPYHHATAREVPSAR